MIHVVLRTISPHFSDVETEIFRCVLIRTTFDFCKPYWGEVERDLLMTGSGMELGPGGVIITFKRVPYTVFCAQLESLNLSNRCRVLIAQLGITFVYVATEQIELDRSPWHILQSIEWPPV